MASDRPAQRRAGTAGKQPALLERMGARYLARGGSATEALDEIHVLNDRERAELRGVVRGAIARAALAGALNAIVTGVGAIYASRLLGEKPEHASLAQTASYWGVFGGLAALFAVLEIAYLYWDALRSVRRLSTVAGLALNGESNMDVARALARAAFELPNPPDHTLGIDPHREASRFELTAASIVYKLKISATNFLFKALFARAFGRFVARGVLEFTAIPVNAAWNALVCWSVLREAQVRVMGPSAAIELVEAALDGNEAPSAPLLAAVHQAVGSAVVRTKQLHPNHVALLRRLRERFGAPEGQLVIDDPQAFLKALAKLAPSEKRVAIRMLAAAAILDGRLVRRERELLARAYQSAGMSERIGKVRELRAVFMTGSGSLRQALHETA